MPPTDFGLSPARTLAHTAPLTRPPGFVHFWSPWADAIRAMPASLEPVTPELAAEAGAPGVTHTLRSTDDTRIGIRLSLPSSNPPAVVVTSHGYHLPADTPLTDDDPWTPKGLAVIKVRVRGYPGSLFDTPLLTEQPGGYITHNLGPDPAKWILAGAVADLALAVRAARNLVGHATPIFLHGESFGGGLATIAAARLTDIQPVARLALGVPTFGDWSWRHANPTDAGAGFDIRKHLDANPTDAEAIRHTLDVFDAAVHAQGVLCPTLAKLALRDAIVPAPTAAAIYNALGVDPGEKWRFVVSDAHCDPGETTTADLRRHALFERLLADFFDPAQDPEDVMEQWAQRCDLPDDHPAAR